MTYPSERDRGMTALLILLILVLAAVSAAALIYLKGPLGIAITAVDSLIALLLVWILLSTRYTFEEDMLILRSGPLREAYPYDTIKSAVRTRGYSFVMALSFDRLELNPGLNPERGKIVLSPQREDDFLEELARRCPGIIIK